MNNGEAGDLRRNRAHYEVTFMIQIELNNAMSYGVVYVCVWLVILVKQNYLIGNIHRQTHSLCIDILLFNPFVIVR